MKNLLALLLITFVTQAYAQFSMHPNLDQIVIHKQYILSYNEQCEQANWVQYRVVKKDTTKKKYRRSNNFRPDKLVTTSSAQLMDYYKSKHDRGHLAPAAVFAYDKEAMSESFYMSNMSPQKGSFNRGIWKRLEAYVREKLAEKYDTLYVVSGPVLQSGLETIGPNKVCIPKQYYKVIYTPEGTICYLLNHEKSKADLDSFIVPMDSLRKVTLINFKQ